MVCWNTAVSMFGRLASGIPGLVCILWKVTENRGSPTECAMQRDHIANEKYNGFERNLEFLILCEV